MYSSKKKGIFERMLWSTLVLTGVIGGLGWVYIHYSVYIRTGAAFLVVLVTGHIVLSKLDFINMDSIKLPKFLKSISFERRVKKNLKYPTKRGHLVQSRGEMKIADFLHLNKHSYTYDKKIKLNSCQIRPDFIISKGLFKPKIYIEYLGMKDNPEYDKHIEYKKTVYESVDSDVIYVERKHLDNIDSHLQKELGKVM